MKKLFAVLAIPAAMTACNNESETTTTGTDTIKPVDSPAVKVDSPAVKLDSPAVKVDSPAKK